MKTETTRVLKDFQLHGTGYLNIGVGVTYRPSDNFTMTLRPANARWTFVTDKDLQKAGNYGLKNDGDSSLFSLDSRGLQLIK